MSFDTVFDNFEHVFVLSIASLSVSAPVWKYTSYNSIELDTSVSIDFKESLVDGLGANDFLGGVVY